MYPFHRQIHPMVHNEWKEIVSNRSRIQMKYKSVITDVDIHLSMINPFKCKELERNVNSEGEKKINKIHSFIMMTIYMLIFCCYWMLYGRWKKRRINLRHWMLMATFVYKLLWVWGSTHNVILFSLTPPSLLPPLHIATTQLGKVKFLSHSG